MINPLGYIFSGSEQSVMLAMLQDKTRAFYKLGRILNLGAIEKKIYLDFIYKFSDTFMPYWINGLRQTVN